MDGFLQAEGSNATFGYYDQTDIPYYWSLAHNYTLFDNYFTSAMGPSLPNHLYLVSGQDAGVADSVTNQKTNLNIGSIANNLENAKVSWAKLSRIFKCTMDGGGCGSRERSIGRTRR